MDLAPNFLMEYISDYLSGSVQQWEFDLDYDGYVIDHFPAMEASNPALARRFADNIDRAVDYAHRAQLAEDDFKACIAKAYSELV